MTSNFLGLVQLTREKELRKVNQMMKTSTVGLVTLRLKNKLN
jgi:hypothetical protein